MQESDSWVNLQYKMILRQIKFGGKSDKSIHTYTQFRPHPRRYACIHKYLFTYKLMIMREQPV